MMKSLDFLSKLMPLFTAGIFLFAFLSFHLVILNNLIDAKIEVIRENQSRFIKEQKEMNDRIVGIINDLKIKLADK